MSTKSHVLAYFKRTQDWDDAKMDRIAALVVPYVTADASTAELWKWTSFALFGSFPEGGGIADDTKVQAVTQRLIADEASIWDVEPDNLDPVKKLQIAFDVNDRARKDGWKPKKAPSYEDKLNAVSLERLAERFDNVGDVAFFRSMTATKRLEYARVLVGEQEAAAAADKRAVEKADAVDDDTLSPEKRLARHWA